MLSVQIQLPTALKHFGVQPRPDETTNPFADLDETSEDEQEGDGESPDNELQELVQQFDPELNASDYVDADEDHLQYVSKKTCHCVEIHRRSNATRSRNQRQRNARVLAE